MSRIRTIKPEFWTSEQVMECSPLARLAFIGMWNFCDDNGVHPASCKTLKAQIFPGDDITTANVQAIVDELINQQLVGKFKADNREWWFVTGWHHQLINRPSPSRYPHPPHNKQTHGALSEDSVSAHGVLSEDSVSAHGVLSEDSLTEGKGREGNIERKGRDMKGERETRTRANRAQAKTSLPHDLVITPELQEWADQRGYGNLDMHLEAFKDKAQARGYQYTDWEAALRIAVRDDWAGIRKQGQARHHSTSQHRDEAKLETYHKLTGGLAGRRNGKPSYDNIIDITPATIRVG